MPLCHHHARLPTRWLMTDERMGRGLWHALASLPRGSGVVFRHYATPAAERRRLFAQVLRRARERGIVVVRAGEEPMRGEMGVHNGRGRGVITASVHDRAQVRAARRLGACIVFVSPMFATRSHPGARALRLVEAQRLVHATAIASVALGGMDARRFATLRGFHGWAGIDAWARAGASGQKRKAVPT